MPDNPFENKAKQKLDDLKFIPSDAVWQKVEAGIKKDKDRRRLLIWLPLFCLLLGAGGWYFISGHSQSHPGKEAIALSKEGKNKSDAPAVQSAPLKEKVSVLPDNNNTGMNLKQPEMTKSGNGFTRHQRAARTTGQQKKDLLITTQRGKKKADRIPVGGQDKTSIGKENNQHIVSQNKTSGGKENNQRGISNEYTDENRSPDTGSPDNEHPEKDISVNGPRVPDTDSASQHKSAITASHVEDSLKNPAEKNKLQWSIAAGFGRSSVATKFIHDNSLYNAPATGGSPSPANLPTLPSARPSSSYYLGLQLQKPLNKTTQIFTGVQYAYSGIRITKGNQVNLPLTLYTANYSITSLSSYYAPPVVSNFNYTNHYHFLEIPLGIEKQLGRKSRFSVNAGLSVAWLISTNALQYDPQTKIYFRDDSYFNRTQWNILGGIQYSLLKKEKYSLKIGPRVQYGLSSLLNNKSPYSEHRFSGGLQLLLISNRK